MKRTHKLFVSIAAFAALGLGTAYAQPFGPFGGPESCPHAQGMGMGMMGGMGKQGKMGPGAQGKGQVDFAASAAARLDKLKADLKITPEQEKAWQGFADQSKKQIEQMQAMRTQFQPPAANATPATLPSTPERMEKAIEFMKQRLTHMEEMNASMKNLYATLTPDQKTIIEKHFSQRPGQGNQGRGRMMRRAPQAAAQATQ